MIFRHRAPQLSERGQVGVGKVCLQAPLCSGRGVPLHRTAGELHCSSLSPGSHQGLVRWQAMPVSLSSRSCRVGPRPQDHVPFGIGATTYFLCNFVCSSFQATHPTPPAPILGSFRELCRHLWPSSSPRGHLVRIIPKPQPLVCELLLASGVQAQSLEAA